MKGSAGWRRPLFSLKDGTIDGLRLVHLVGVMGTLRTVLPFKLAATDEEVTAHDGLVVVARGSKAGPENVSI
jgi:hypothetical protein